MQMQTQAVWGTEYLVPKGWEPIATAPMDRQVNIMYVGGAYGCGFVGQIARQGATDHFAWREIEAPKGVERTFSDALTNGVPV